MGSKSEWETYNVCSTCENNHNGTPFALYTRHIVQCHVTVSNECKILSKIHIYAQFV